MRLVHCAIVAVAYLVTAKLGLLLAFAHTNATPVWPPTGIALAVCIVFGRRLWPGIFVGAFLANVTLLGGGASLSSLLLSLGTAAGNTLEALLGAWLVQRRGVLPFRLDRVRDTLRFIVLGAIISPLVSASIGTACFCLYRSDRAGGGEMWLTWWLGDMAGALIFAPLLLAWTKRNPFSIRLANSVEAAVWLLVFALVEAVIFRLNYPLEYLTLPILFWTAFRFGQFEAALAVTLAMLTELLWTIQGYGPFAEKPLHEGLLFLQSFMAAASAATLIVGALIATRDRTEEALRSSEEHYRSIFESAPVGIFHSTYEGRFVNVNPTLAAMFGYATPQEMVAKVSRIAAELFVNPEERQRLIDRARSSEGFVLDEICYKRADGSRFIANLYMRVVGENGPAGHLEGFVEDITERKSAEKRQRDYQSDLEQAIRLRTGELESANEKLLQEIEVRKRAEGMLVEREAQYRDLVESANSVIVRWRPDGTILFINRFAENFFGYCADEIIGRNFVGTIVPASDSVGRPLDSLPADIVAHPESFVRNENENIRKNGERVWIAWTNKPIPAADGTTAEVLSIGVDITQLVHTERELRRTLDELGVAKERAEAADRLKSAFLATMSHELRTPLNSIIGFTGIVLQGLAGPLNDEQKKQLSMVKTSADHLLSLISDVLDISKIEAGQLTVACSTFHLPDAIGKAVATMAPQAQKKGLQLDAVIDGDVGEVRSDQRRVEQVLLNLLSNAVKFTESGRIDLACRREGGDYIVTVADTGIGIDPEHAERLFQPFYQIETGLSRKYDGTGLGLSICQKLLELMGGTIWLESTPGVGSSFGFRLPILPP